MVARFFFNELPQKYHATQEKRRKLEGSWETSGRRLIMEGMGASERGVRKPYGSGEFCRCSCDMTRI